MTDTITWEDYAAAKREALAAHTVARASGGMGVARMCRCGYPTQTGRTPFCEAIERLRDVLVRRDNGGGGER